MRKLWMRLGVTVELTETEAAQVLLENNNPADKHMEAIVKKAYLEGRVRPDGETYVPEMAAEDFNKKYGTAYPTDEPECDVSVTDEEIREQKLRDFIETYIDLARDAHTDDSDIILGLLRLFAEEDLKKYGYGNFIAQINKEE